MARSSPTGVYQEQRSDSSRCRTKTEAICVRQSVGLHPRDGGASAAAACVPRAPAKSSAQHDRKKKVRIENKCKKQVIKSAYFIVKLPNYIESEKKKVKQLPAT